VPRSRRRETPTLSGDSGDRLALTVRAGRSLPDGCRAADRGQPDLLVRVTFPQADRTRIRGTKRQKVDETHRSNAGALRRHFPDTASLIRVVGMVLFERDDEWQERRRYFLPEPNDLDRRVAIAGEVSPAPRVAS
jgi:transposase-like protein